MALKDILEDVEKKKQERLTYINTQCNKELEAIRQSSEKEIDNIRKEFKSKLASDLEITERRERDSINMEKNSMILKKKTEIVSSLLENLNIRLPELRRNDKYESILSDSLKVAERDLGKDFIVKCAPEDAEILGKKMKEIKIQKDPAIRLGIICNSANGERIIDFRVDRLFKEVRQELEAMILENIGAN